MGRKLRIAILYNEPVSSSREERQYVSESGQLKETRSPLKQTKAAERKQAEAPVLVDLSEVGVVEEMDDIKAALTSLGYKPATFNVDSNIFRLLEYLRDERPDLIFNIVESVENEAFQEMNVAGLYELLKIPYTGAGAVALGLALHKPRVKEILSYHGIKTPKFQVFRVTDKIALEEGLTFPLMVKPSREDASVGIEDRSVVYNITDLKNRVRYIQEEFDQPALVEQYINGRELNIAVIGNKNPLVLPISEIDFSGLTEGMHKIVSYEAKWVHGSVAFEGTKGVCPAALTPLQENKLKDMAMRCYQIVGCRDYARVDFRLTKEGVPYVLEVNPNPDISDDAGFARSARTYGFTFPEVIGKIVESALERYR
jgi:D-alanine-D-alanine ligase